MTVAPEGHADLKTVLSNEVTAGRLSQQSVKKDFVCTAIMSWLFRVSVSKVLHHEQTTVRRKP